MSQETIEIAPRELQQFNRDFASSGELDLDLLAPDVVFDNSNAALDAAVYRGHEGMREERVIVPVQIVSVGRERVEVVAR